MEPKHKITVTYTPKEITELVGGRSEIDMREVERSAGEKFPEADCNVEGTPKDKPKCIGCQFDEPGQKAHMDYGGCLYVGSDSEE